MAKPTKKAPAKKAVAKKVPAKKVPLKKPPPKKASPRNPPPKKAIAKKTPAKKAIAKKPASTPGWLDALRRNLELSRATLLAKGDRGGTPKHEDFDGWTPIAVLPPLVDTDDEARTVVWIRDAKPDQTWLGLHAHTPPWLFVPSGQTAESVISAARAFDTAERERTHELRCFIGIVPNMTFIENKLVTSRDIGSGPPLLSTIATTELPDPEQLLVMTSRFQFRWSGAVIELHGLAEVIPDARVVAATIQYAPVPYPAQVEAANAESGQRLPLDLPLDVLNELKSLPTRTDEECLEEIRGGTEPGLFLFAGALNRIDDIAALERLVAECDGAPGVLGHAAEACRAMFLAS
ncbi:MAG TPA: hypothetical protein VGM90_00085 [Kofleriaceae bacterium]|jgi:hypothetical protein